MRGEAAAAVTRLPCGALRFSMLVHHFFFSSAHLRHVARVCKVPSHIMEHWGFLLHSLALSTLQRDTHMRVHSFSSLLDDLLVATYTHHHPAFLSFLPPSPSLSPTAKHAICAAERETPTQPPATCPSLLPPCPTLPE